MLTSSFQSFDTAARFDIENSKVPKDNTDENSGNHKPVIRISNENYDTQELQSDLNAIDECHWQQLIDSTHVLGESV